MQQLEPGRVLLDTLLWGPLFCFILWWRDWNPLGNSNNKGVIPRDFSFQSYFCKSGTLQRDNGKLFKERRAWVKPVETASQAPGTYKKNVQMNLFGVPRFNSQVLFTATIFSVTYLYILPAKGTRSYEKGMPSLFKFKIHYTIWELIFFSRAPRINLSHPCHDICMHKCSFYFICILKSRTQGVLRTPCVSSSWMFWHMCHSTPRRFTNVTVQ